MTDRIKLTEPGESAVLMVAEVSVETISDKAYAKFTGSGKELLVPMSSFERQMKRLDVTNLYECKGKTIKFSRSEKVNEFGKPFWNLDIAGPAERSAAQAAATSKRLPSPVPGEAPTQYRVPAPGPVVPPPSDADFPGEPPEAIDYPVRGVAGQAGAKAGQWEADYVACLNRMADVLVAIQARTDIPMDGSALNAVTFSVMKGGR